METKNKCTLLIDGNWLLRSRGSKFEEDFSSDKSDLEKNIAKTQTVDLMARSVAITLMRFQGVVDNMILCVDSKSWRKSVDRPSSLVAEYKGTRKKKANVDWDAVFDSLHMLEECFKSAGVTVSNTWEAEGDDAIWRWSGRLNAEGTNCIIWTSDNDLRQLARYIPGLAWTVWYNDKNGIVADDLLNGSKDDDLMVFMESARTLSNKMLLDQAIRCAGSARWENPDIVIMEKIVCGDKSDNIKSIVRSSKGSKEYRISEKKWNEIREKLGINSMRDFILSKDRILDEAFSVTAVAGTSMTRKDAEEQLEYNMKLVWLDSSQVPESVSMGIDAVEYRVCDTESIILNYKLLTGEDNTAVEELFVF